MRANIFNRVFKPEILSNQQKKGQGYPNHVTQSKKWQKSIKIFFFLF